MSKIKLKQEIFIEIPFKVWLATMFVFLLSLILYNVNSLISEDLHSKIIKQTMIIGSMSFLLIWITSYIQYFRKVILEEKLKAYLKKSIYFSIIFLVSVFLIIFFIPSQNEVNRADSSIVNNNKRCYFDSYRWTTVDENENCEDIVKSQLEAEEKERDSLIESQKNSSANIEKSKTTNNNWEETWKVEKIDDKTTSTKFPEDDRMGTAEELFVAINNFRQAHSISTVQKHDTLCRIAQTRANQLLELGQLDGHAGMSDLAHSQQDFDNMGEVISGGVQKQLAVHTVEWGWGRSLTGHRESILNKKWTHGCGGIAGLFNVFVFGSN